MGKVREFLDDHLRPLAGPYLFVGAGFSRRYADLPGWRDLLARFAVPTGMPIGYYESGTLPTAASNLAAAFHEVWWKSDEFAASKEVWEGRVAGNIAIPLKVEIARYLDAEIEAFMPKDELQEEWDLFKKVTVNGLITTNYDQLLSKAFPDYKVFIGQDGLLFSDPQGIAEIFAIHGTTSNPASLVLTDSDYEDYDSRNSYLGAKLMTVFVEHPVFFLGYSFNDPNIHKILLSVVRGLRDKSVDKLQDRLIFVEWEAGVSPSVVRTQISIDGVLLPVIRIVVPDWQEVFQSLGVRRHALNARTLRILKEQVYEIVLTNDPKERLFAYRDIDDESADDISIVFGVGARVATVGLVGLKRDNIIADVLQSLPAGLPAEGVLDTHIAAVPAKTWYPVYKYLREAGHLDGAGVVMDASTLPDTIVNRELAIRSKIVATAPDRAKRPMEELLATHGRRWVFTNILELPSYTDDLSGFRDFLLSFPEKDEDNVWWRTQYVKGVVVYDYCKYGLGMSMSA
jgi:hypothetical protein